MSLSSCGRIWVSGCLPTYPGVSLLSPVPIFPPAALQSSAQPEQRAFSGPRPPSLRPQPLSGWHLEKREEDVGHNGDWTHLVPDSFLLRLLCPFPNNPCPNCPFLISECPLSLTLSGHRKGLITTILSRVSQSCQVHETHLFGGTCRPLCSAVGTVPV